MFEDLVISAGKEGRSQRNWWLSLLIHSAVVALLLIVPLVRYSELPLSVPLTYLAAAPLPETPPPPPPPVQSVASQQVHSGPPARPIVVIEDPRLAGEIPEAPDHSELPLLSSPISGPTGVPLPGGAQGFPGGEVDLSALSGGEIAVPPPPPPPPVEKTPLRVGGSIQQARKVIHVQPVYPDLARRARVEAVVLLEAQIDELGHVSSVRLLRGHPLLNMAAMEAVKQWKYSPTLLNGEPVPVMTTISVVFSLR